MLFDLVSSYVVNILMPPLDFVKQDCLISYLLICKNLMYAINMEKLLDNKYDVCNRQQDANFIYNYIRIILTCL